MTRPCPIVFVSVLALTLNLVGFGCGLGVLIQYFNDIADDSSCGVIWAYTAAYALSSLIGLWVWVCRLQPQSALSKQLGISFTIITILIFLVWGAVITGARTCSDSTYMWGYQQATFWISFVQCVAVIGLALVLSCECLDHSNRQQVWAEDSDYDEDRESSSCCLRWWREYQLERQQKKLQKAALAAARQPPQMSEAAIVAAVMQAMQAMAANNAVAGRRS